jgi:hypothetical protein
MLWSPVTFETLRAILHVKALQHCTPKQLTQKLIKKTACAQIIFNNLCFKQMNQIQIRVNLYTTSGAEN